jgi:hypothetical protein
MPLLSLPNEILRHIMATLSIGELERLAQTFNRRIMSLYLSMPLVARWSAIYQHDRDMSALFGSPSIFCWQQYCSDVLTMRVDELGPLSLPSEKPIARLRPLQYLALDGSLDWLRLPPDPPMITYQQASLSHVSAFSKAQMRALGETFKQLGVKLPLAFTCFMTDGPLQSLLPVISYWFSFSDAPIKCYSDKMSVMPDGTERAQDGYLYKFSKNYDYE